MRFRKSLGQCFLVNSGAASSIAQRFLAESSESILEVGPGAGALTIHLLGLKSKEREYKAVEIDLEKVAILQERFPEYRDAFIGADFLQITPPFAEQFAIVGNFPYCIASSILFRLLEWRDSVPLLMGMLQKEMAIRILAQPNSKDYGILSVLLGAFYDIEGWIELSEKSFYPQPRVKSKVLIFRRSTKYAVPDVEKFIRVVKQAFSRRRKQLKNNLKLKVPDSRLSLRAEQLAIADFIELSQLLA